LIIQKYTKKVSGGISVMKKMLVFLVIISLLLATAPAAAKQKGLVGERIDIYSGTPTVYAADTPFHIYHTWWAWSPIDTPIGLYDFQLELDGVFIEEDFVARFVDSSELPLSHYLNWVFNFPNGLPEGTHTFTGHWFSSCKVLIKYGFPVECSTPSEYFETQTISLEVTFY
jgi:hypothetical protein